MDSFTKVIMIVRLVFVQFLIVITLPGFIAWLKIDIEAHEVGKDISYLISAFLISGLCIFWLVRTIIRPKLQSGSGQTKTLDHYYISGFPSTHPWYIFIDAILFLWVLAFGEFNDNSTLAVYRYYVILILAISIPLFRLVCWYIMGLKINKEECVLAWKPVMWFWVIAGPFVLMIFIF